MLLLFFYSDGHHFHFKNYFFMCTCILTDIFSSACWASSDGLLFFFLGLLVPKQNVWSKPPQCSPSLGLSSFVLLFPGLWRPRKSGIQPVSNFPQGPQIVTGYLLSRTYCLTILGRCINYLLPHYNITTNLAA